MFLTISCKSFLKGFNILLAGAEVSVLKPKVGIVNLFRLLVFIEKTKSFPSQPVDKASKFFLSLFLNKLDLLVSGYF